MKLFFQKVIRIMVITIGVLIICALVLAGVLWLRSPGKMQPFLNQNGNPLPGSISEKIFVEINGIQQGMIIKSKDAANPVLLYLHGDARILSDAEIPHRFGRQFHGCLVGAARLGLSFTRIFPRIP